MEITMYSTGCPNCKRLESRLKAANLTYNICNDLNKLKELNFSNIPMLDIDGTLFGYRPAINWINNYIQEEDAIEN